MFSHPWIDSIGLSKSPMRTQRVNCIQILSGLQKFYVVNFPTEEAVRKAGDKIHLVDMEKVTLYENLSIGDETWLCISALEEDMDTKPFL